MKDSAKEEAGYDDRVHKAELRAKGGDIVNPILTLRIHRTSNYSRKT